MQLPDLAMAAVGAQLSTPDLAGLAGSCKSVMRALQGVMHTRREPADVHPSIQTPGLHVLQSALSACL